MQRNRRSTDYVIQIMSSSWLAARKVGIVMAEKVRAYLLIEAAAGSGNDVLIAVRGMSATVQADRVTGPYDVIAVMESDSLDQISSVIHDDVQAVSGITRVMSCLRFEA